MFDASVKSPVGVEYGVEYQFGNFDQCMAIKTNLAVDGVDIASKYCLVDVDLPGYVVRKAAVRKHQVRNFFLENSHQKIPKKNYRVDA